MSTQVSTKSTPPVTNATAPASGILDRARQLLRTDFGQMPVLIAVVLMAIYFNTATTPGLFLGSENLSNMALQSTTIGIIALASVLVLLLGEIDLSLAVVAYLCGAVMCSMSVFRGWGLVPSILAALVVGAVIGAFNGFLVAVLRVPAFIVTLAGLLAYQGVLQHITLPDESILLHDPSIISIATSFLTLGQGIALAVVAIAAYGGLIIYSRFARVRKGLTVKSWPLTLLNVGFVGVPILAALYIFSNYQGVPYLTVILIGLVVVTWLVLRFTTFGRHVYAVGGNAEAARRAGISVVRTRIIIFTLASTLAAVAGVLEAARSTTATANIDQSLLLKAIAAAVIGGVSLFGGRGSVWGAVIGTVVIGGLINGLALQARTADVQYIVEGVVLLLAVMLDAVLRRRNAVTGR